MISITDKGIDEFADKIAEKVAEKVAAKVVEKINVKAAAVADVGTIELAICLSALVVIPAVYFVVVSKFTQTKLTIWTRDSPNYN